MCGSKSNGTCAIVALVNPNTSMLYVANLGDSRAYLMTRTATGISAIKQSNEHWFENEQEKNRVTFAAGRGNVRQMLFTHFCRSLRHIKSGCKSRFAAEWITAKR
jgi:serine/threonine protein phosphatase PrpC